MLVGIRPDPVAQGPQAIPPNGFETFGQLAPHGRQPVRAQGADCIGQDGLEITRRDVEDQGGAFVCKRFQAFLALARLCRQKALEAKAIAGQPCRGQRCDRGAWTRHRGHADAAGVRAIDQPVTRIRDQRRARVGDQRDVLPTGQEFDQLFDRSRLVVIVQRDPARRLFARWQQLAADACVLCGDDVGLGQHVTRPLRKVVKIAQGGGDDPERPGCDR